MPGSCVKQRMGTARPIASQPRVPTSSVSIRSRVMPCSGLRGWEEFNGRMPKQNHIGVETRIVPQRGRGVKEVADAASAALNRSLMNIPLIGTVISMK